MEGKVLTLSDKISFGKYKNGDKDIQWIIKNDPAYIKWIYDNKIRNVCFSEDIINIITNPFFSPLSAKIRRGFCSYSDDSYVIEKDYSQSHFDLLDGDDYYPTGCDIYNFG